jgi:hypothetical protein
VVAQEVRRSGLHPTPDPAHSLGFAESSHGCCGLSLCQNLQQSCSPTGEYLTQKRRPETERAVAVRRCALGNSLPGAINSCDSLHQLRRTRRRPHENPPTDVATVQQRRPRKQTPLSRS